MTQNAALYNTLARKGTMQKLETHKRAGKLVWLNVARRTYQIGREKHEQYHAERAAKIQEEINNGTYPLQTPFGTITLEEALTVRDDETFKALTCGEDH